MGNVKKKFSHYNKKIFRLEWSKKGYLMPKLNEVIKKSNLIVDLVKSDKYMVINKKIKII